MYPAPSPAGRNDSSKFIMVPTAGKRTLCTISGATKIRAIFEFNTSIYAIADSSVYKLTINDTDKTATTTLIGTVSLAGERIFWDRNPTQIMFGDGGTSGYILTPSTDTLSQITDPDFTGLSSVVFIDSYFMYSTPNTGLVHATAINDGSSIDPLDVTTAEASPDNIVGLASDKRELWVFGSKSVQIYWNAANPTGFPFSVRDGAHINLGCAAAASIINFDNSLMWIDHRGFIVRANGYAPEVISTPDISAEIQSYTRFDDCFAYQHFDRGSLFAVFCFPSAKKTWAYDAVTQQWHERAYWNAAGEFEHDLTNCHAQYGKWDLVGDRQSGNIYILDKDTYTEGGNPIHRISSTKVFSNEFDLVGCDCLQLRVETGKSSPTDDEPYFMLRYSNDGGYVWSDELWRSFGATGNYNKPITWNRLGTSREWMFEIRVTAPCKFAIIDAAVTVSGSSAVGGGQ